MNKILIWMFLIIVSSATAFADDANLIMNDTSIVGGCNVSNLGAASGTVNLVPQFELATYVCNPGYYLPADAEGCVICPNDNYCVGGAYQYNATTPQGISECPNSWYSPEGMHELSSCGRILHIGDNVVYLRSVKKTTPSLNVQIGNNIFYGNMTVGNVSMTDGTDRQLKLQYGGQTYSVYDDSATGTYDLSTLNKNTNGDVSYAITDTGTCYYRTSSMSSYSTLSCSDANYSDLTAGKWKTEFSYGTVYGDSKCSSTSGTYATSGNPVNTTGASCWCRATGFIPDGEDVMYDPAVSLWVFGYTFGSASGCASGCTRDCGGYVRVNSGFRSGLFGSVAN